MLSDINHGCDREAAWGDSTGSAAVVTQRLLAAAEAAKIELSSQSDTIISPPGAEPIGFSSQQLADVTAGLLKRLGLPLDRLACDTFMHWHDWCV